MLVKPSGFPARTLISLCLLWPQLSDPSDLPKNAYSIFLLLVEHLCVDHIDYALEIGLSGTSRRRLTED